ncbi:MAG: hypothetical protein QME42_06420 [bacterium]|nr:hypothetical protein [bacterium]
MKPTDIIEDPIYQLNHLLNESTANFYERWQSKDTRRALRRFCGDLLTNALKSAETHFEKSTLSQPHQGITLNISNEEARETIIDSLTKFRRGKWIKREELNQLELFSQDDI